MSTVGRASLNPIAAQQSPTIVAPSDEISLSTNEKSVPIRPGTYLPERYTS